MGASGSTINVGLQGSLESQAEDGNKTYVSNQGPHGSTIMAHRTLPIGPRHSPGSDQAADGWVETVVATPLFPNGRPPGADRQARHQKRVSKFRVFSDGVVFEGPEASSMDSHDLAKGYERLMGRGLTKVMVADKRAQQVLVAYADGRFWAVPSRQIFSRHLGVCLILGDKSMRGAKHKLQVGDIIRVGSVGLLVSEINSGIEGQEKQVVSQSVLDNIREDINTAPTQVLAPLREQFELGRAEEGEEEEEEDDLGAGSQCYICMDEAESEQDALIAPCQCKGSTALVHVRCLQRLLSTGDAHKANVVSTRHESHTCKICKARYKTHVKLKDGTLVPLLNPTLAAPSLSLIVVTRHEPHPDLFNNIFQLSFARTSELSLGRSQACDVVIGYRTVSTRHATISYSRGEFFYQDNRSSNGSLLYLRAPLELPYNRVVRLRMGRSVLSLRARKTLQLSSLPRRTALDAVRWVSSLVRRHSPSSLSQAEHTTVDHGNPAQPHTDPLSQISGVELLRRLFEGQLELHKDPSIEEAIEQMNMLAWSMADDSSSEDRSQDETRAQDGEEDEDEEMELDATRGRTRRGTEEMFDDRRGRGGVAGGAAEDGEEEEEDEEGKEEEDDEEAEEEEEGPRRRRKRGEVRPTASTAQAQDEEMKSEDKDEEEEEEEEEDDLPPEGPRFLQPCSRSETGIAPPARPFLHRTRSSVV